MRTGRAPSLLATKDTYLTAPEAAGCRGVSRPTMIRILDLGEVAYERPNSHRQFAQTR